MSGQSPLRFAWSYIRHFQGRLLLAILWRTLYILTPMQIPILTGGLIDGLDGQRVELYGFIRMGETPREIVSAVAVGLLVLALVFGAASYFRTTAIAQVSRHFVAELRKSLMEKIELLSLDVHRKYGAGELLSRAVTDTQSLRRFTEKVFIQTIADTVRIVYPLIMLLIINPTLTLLALTILPMQWGLTHQARQRLRAASRRARKSQAGLTTVVKENLDGIETIQALSAEKNVIQRVSQQAERLETDELRTNRHTGTIRGFVWGLTYLGYALVWWQGGLQVIEGEMTLGMLVAFTGFVSFMYTPFRTFSDVVNVYHKGVVALERIQEVLETESSVQEAPKARPLYVQQGEVEFQGVSFAYDQQAVLSDVNLCISPKRLTAIVGRSGSGKSSLLKLIARLYDPTGGEVCIDGQDLRDVKLVSLRAQIAVVPQVPMIFTGTMLENICLGQLKASQAEVEQACAAAGALDFIVGLEKGFNTRLGEKGANVSGGEAQRISIARALLRRPKILLLDEPTSALDYETEAAIMATLHRLKKEMTVIIIGHRLDALSGADCIVVVDNGQIMEVGSHEELLALRGVYSDLFLENRRAENETLHLPSNA